MAGHLHDGIGFMGHHLGYAFRGGFGKGWMPYWMMKVIVTAWNFIACHRYGHWWHPCLDEAEWTTVNDKPIPLVNSVQHDRCVHCMKQRPHVYREQKLP